KALEAIESRAKELKIKGVAVAAIYDQNKVLHSQMKAVGTLCSASVNFMAVAYSKVAEMCDTLKNSGGKTRPPLFGEYEYLGGAIKERDQVYYLAAFSGASGEEDLDAAMRGLNLF
ncbi:MAG: hypothetical protein PHC61_11095, partial [Chitinivibrionales bacterium]|nr:hypothetical protein [Chitinivibrionales bacterium]